MSKNTECTVITGNAIPLARLAVIKSALRLEKAGLSSRGGAIRPKLAADLGLKPRDSYDVYIAKVQKLMDDGLAALQEANEAIAKAAA